MRKDKLITGNIYHILNKSIEGYKIFNCDNDYYRFIEIMRYYSLENIEYKYSRYRKLVNKGKDIKINYNFKNKKIVDIIAYCIMPTHIHLILRQLKENSISRYMRIILDSYAKYFNTSHNRKGPLWIGKFKNVFVNNDEQLFHLTRYLHLNPTSSDLVNNPEDWEYSSYKEYLKKNDDKNKISNFTDVLDIDPIAYEKFVQDRRFYQRELSKIKKLVIE